MSSDKPTTSVILTVRNERDTVDALLATLAAQTRRPDEVVIVDGGSRDGTLQALQRASGTETLPLTVLSRPGLNISSGRNAAIAAARGPIIASTDAGVRLVPEWLALLADALEGGASVASGFFASDPVGPFETALGAATLPEAGDIDGGKFLPSSRSVAFWKADWDRVGGYPEWLDFGEDLVFDMRLLEAAGGGVFVPEAVARFRPRQSLSAFARQYYLYARGDGKADLWRRRHAVRYATYLVALPALCWLTFRSSPAWGFLLAAGFALMVARPYRRLVRQWRRLSVTSRMEAALWIPVIRVAGDIAKMAGYPVGLAWRARHRPPEWRPAAQTGSGW